jgi:hypothetical protein
LGNWCGVFLLYLVFYLLLMSPQRRKLFVAYRRCRRWNRAVRHVPAVRRPAAGSRPCATVRYFGAESKVANGYCGDIATAYPAFSVGRKGIGKGLLRDMKMVEHAYSFSGFISWLLCPSAFSAPRHLDGEEQSGAATAPGGTRIDGGSGRTSSRLIVLFIMMAVLFLFGRCRKSIAASRITPDGAVSQGREDEIE